MEEFKNQLRLLIQQICREFQGQEIPKRPVWTVVGSPPRVALDVDRPAFSDLLFCLTVGLSRRPEYRAVADAAENDAELKEGIIVDAGGILHEPEPSNMTRALATNFLWSYLSQGKLLDWNKTRFDETFAELKSQLRRKNIIIHTTLPLSNLKIDVNELDFGSVLKLSPATTDELERWIDPSQSIPPLGAGRPQWNSNYMDRPAVFHSHHTVVGRPPSADLQEDMERLPRVNIGHALSALRLVMKAPISVIFQEQETVA